MIIEIFVGTVKDSALTFEFDQLQLKSKVDFSIELKTVSTEGIIFYVTQPQRKDFIALYLKDSKVRHHVMIVVFSANFSSFHSFSF